MGDMDGHGTYMVINGVNGGASRMSSKDTSSINTSKKKEGTSPTIQPVEQLSMSSQCFT